MTKTIQNLTELDNEVDSFFRSVISSTNPNVTRHDFRIDLIARTISFNCAGYTKMYRDLYKGNYLHSQVYASLMAYYKISQQKSDNNNIENVLYPFGTHDAKYNIDLEHDPHNSYDPNTERLTIYSDNNPVLAHLHGYCLGYVPAVATPFIHKHRDHFTNIKIYKFCTNLPGKGSKTNNNARLMIFYGQSSVCGVSVKGFKRFHDIVRD